ncbi:UNVERIFIED_CONTAM: hypothetical protein FKN15_062148 [Acipenser sinensis]
MRRKGRKEKKAKKEEDKREGETGEKQFLSRRKKTNTCGIHTAGSTREWEKQ